MKKKKTNVLFIYIAVWKGKTWWWSLYEIILNYWNLNSLNIQSEHNALDTINRLEVAIYAWKESTLIQSITSHKPEHHGP